MPFSIIRDDISKVEADAIENDLVELIVTGDPAGAYYELVFNYYRDTKSGRIQLPDEELIEFWNTLTLLADEGNIYAMELLESWD